MQAALASLVPSKSGGPPGVPTAALAQQVADALRRALGVQEPRLIGLLKVCPARAGSGSDSCRAIPCLLDIKAPDGAICEVRTGLLCLAASYRICNMHQPLFMPLANTRRKHVVCLNSFD